MYIDHARRPQPYSSLHYVPFRMTTPSCHVEQSETSVEDKTALSLRGAKGDVGVSSHTAVTPRSQRRRGSLFTHSCHSEEPKATWESLHTQLSLRGRAYPTVGVSPSRAPFVCPIHPSTKREILTSRPSAAPQNDRTAKIAYKELCADFSSKGVSSGADMKLARIGCTKRTAYSRQ